MRTHRSRLVLLLVATLVASACGEVPPTAVPPVTPGATTRPPAITPTSSPTSSPTPASQAPTPTSAAGCPERSFDASAVLGPEFDQDIFAHDESRAITQAFVDGLSAIYARSPGADVCAIFTAHGLATALVADPRLRDVLRGETAVDGTLILRVAFEGTYDLRDRPPVVPVDAIFDLPAGARITDVVSGQVRVTTADERIGFNVRFAFDGHRWLADEVGPVSADNTRWAQIPAPLPPGPPCSSFRRDRAGAPFSVYHRTWCDGDGRGRVIDQEAQLVLITRYPCDRGHAAILTIGRPLGATIDPLVMWTYVRDPGGVYLAAGRLADPYDGDSRLPKEAAYTGWTNGNIELWTSPTTIDRFVYIVRGTVVERWPRTSDPFLVIDCN